MRKDIKGFTVIEIIFIVLVLSVAAIFFFVQKRDITLIAQDNASKTAINAIYYSLEGVFYPSNNYYPQSITPEQLKSVDPDLFTDSEGNLIGTAGSLYSYTPLDCTDNKCKGYTLRAILNKEDDYTKTSQRD